MFWRRKPPLDLTDEAYCRWLRAYRPPFHWFLSLGEGEQEALAQHGDAFAVTEARVLAGVFENPEAAGAMQGDLDAEEGLARKIGRAMLEREQARKRPASWAGYGGRQQTKATATAKPRRRRMFGREADEVAG